MMSRVLRGVAAMVAGVGSLSCSEIGAPLPTAVPVMVGPVSRIGGSSDLHEGGKRAEFDEDNESSLWICWGTGYPTVSTVSPDVNAVLGSIGAANAELAGTVPLRDVRNRLTGIDVGAYAWFGFGCYGQGWWWNADGEAVAR